MTISPATKCIVASWLIFVGGYAGTSLLLPPGPTLTYAADIQLCLVPLFANAGLLWNAASPYRRRNSFWMLLALGCTFWLIGQLIWTYCQLVLRYPVNTPFPGDIIFFLHTVPLMAALALQPHARKKGETLRYGYLDLLLLSLWWFYLYVFFVIPWNTVWPDPNLFHAHDLELYLAGNLVFLFGLAILVFRTRGAWRTVYGHLFGAAFTYLAALLIVVEEVRAGKYFTGSLYDLPLVASFVWFGTAGIVAHRLSPVPEMPRETHRENTQWPARLAMLGLLSMPLFAGWSALASGSPRTVREFRLVLTLVAIIVGASLIFLRQFLVDRERARLLHNLQESLENLKRLQTQLVQAEKLASLGQLAAGAAHEINNPLTAILGYCDLLATDESAGERTRGLGEKIREQARRTKVLVTNLLSFARKVPAEKQLLDVNAVLVSAVQLRTLDLRDKDIRLELQNPTVLPAVRADPNQLLQVFYHLISNAVDAMEPLGGGLLTVKAFRERANVVIEFSDTGPGLEDPNRVFDPFYTTKPVGKGTGLGLSICHGIMEAHGGKISGHNRVEGGCVFRIELPAVLALFPQPVSPPGAPVGSP